VDIKKLAMACVLLAAMSVGTYGYLTWEPKTAPIMLDDVSPITSVVTPEPLIKELVVEEPVIEIPKMAYPQSTRVTGKAVYVSIGGALGTGVVIDSRTVLTIAHVVKNQKLVMVDVGRYARKWVPAIVMGKIHATPEDIVILKITTNDTFLDVEHFTRGAGIGLPMLMVTTKGVFPWNPGSVVPGDSGGAVLNIDGELIGLVVGYKIKGKHGVAAIFR
jgi:S1-C subfamily serine protease